MILHKKSSKKEISSILQALPNSNEILLIESSKKERYERIGKTRFPGEQINKKYSMIWMKNSEFNYEIIKKILLEYHGPMEENPVI